MAQRLNSRIKSKLSHKLQPKRKLWNRQKNMRRTCTNWPKTSKSKRFYEFTDTWDHECLSCYHKSSRVTQSDKSCLTFTPLLSHFFYFNGMFPHTCISSTWFFSLLMWIAVIFSLGQGCAECEWALWCADCSLWDRGVQKHHRRYQCCRGGCKEGQRGGRQSTHCRRPSLINIHLKVRIHTLPQKVFGHFRMPMIYIKHKRKRTFQAKHFTKRSLNSPCSQTFYTLKLIFDHQNYILKFFFLTKTYSCLKIAWM